MQPEQRTAYLAAEARTHDPDRYLGAVFAPAERREAVLGLILLNHELARVPDIVSQPMLGLIRYQWWRDAVEEIGQGRVREHPVVTALAGPVSAGWVEPGTVQALIDAREQAFEGELPTDPAGLEAYVAQTSGAVQRLIYTALGGASPAEAGAAAEIGTALGLARMARAIALEAGTDSERLTAVAPRCEALVARGEALLRAGRAGAGRPARAQMPAFLPVPLVAARLAAMRRDGPAAESRQAPLAALHLLGRYLLRRP